MNKWKFSVGSAQRQVTSTFIFGLFALPEIMLTLRKLSDWFAAHSPFLETQELMSISSDGVVAPEDFNCYMARSICITCFKTCLKKENFEDLKLKRKDKVVTLASVTCSLKIKDKKSQ